jgi:hypothetical protein
LGGLQCIFVDYLGGTFIKTSDIILNPVDESMKKKPHTVSKPLKDFELNLIVEEDLRISETLLNRRQI